MSSTVLIPTHWISSDETRDAISRWLYTNGHGVLSTLMYEYVFEADEARRREIDRLINGERGAAWNTMHQWA